MDAFARHPEADFVFGEALAIDEESGATQPYWMAPFDLDFVRREGFLPQPAVFWRRSAYESVGPFDTRYDYVADCAYWMRAGKDHKFHKVFEFLAIERNHAGTLRESSGDEVWAELKQLRSSYVRLEGVRHERLHRRHQVRWRFYYRLYSTTLLLQSITPRPLRRGPWSQMLAARLDFSRVRLAMSLLPRVGQSLAGGDLFGPAPHWLDQATDTWPIPPVEMSR